MNPTVVTIRDTPTVRIIEQERARTGAATLSAAARSLIQQAHTLRSHERLRPISPPEVAATRSHEVDLASAAE